MDFFVVVFNPEERMGETGEGRRAALLRASTWRGVNEQERKSVTCLKRKRLWSQATYKIGIFFLTKYGFSLMTGMILWTGLGTGTGTYLTTGTTYGLGTRTGTGTGYGLGTGTDLGT